MDLADYEEAQRQVTAGDTCLQERIESMKELVRDTTSIDDRLRKILIRSYQNPEILDEVRQGILALLTQNDEHGVVIGEDYYLVELSWWKRFAAVFNLQAHPKHPNIDTFDLTQLPLLQNSGLSRAFLQDSSKEASTSGPPAFFVRVQGLSQEFTRGMVCEPKEKYSQKGAAVVVGEELWDMIKELNCFIAEMAGEEDNTPQEVKRKVLYTEQNLQLDVCPTENNSLTNKDEDSLQENLYSRKECFVCGDPKSSICSRCHKARYCSQQCQKVHWNAGHKYECTPGGGECLGIFTGREIARSNMVGMRNLGNSCYLSSGLQCLKAAFPLTSYFISGRFQSDLNVSNPLSTKGDVTLAFVRLLRTIFVETKPGRAIAPIQLKETVGRHRPALGNFLQQDASDALAFLLDALHEDCNRIRNKPYVEEPDYIDDPRTLLAQAFQLGYGGTKEGNTKRMKTSMDEALAPENWKLLHCRKFEFDVPRGREAWQRWKQRNDSLVSETVVGQLRSTVTCPANPHGCGRISTVFDPFTVLSLEIPTPTYGRHVSLTNCLEHFMSGEQLDSKNEYFCSACKRHVQAHKELTLWRLPKILVIQLKRFSRGSSILARKLETPVEFPLTGFQVPSFDEFGSENSDTEHPKAEPGKGDDDAKSQDSDSSSSSGDLWGRDEEEIPENRHQQEIDLWAKAPQRIYDCFGVVNHFGNMMFGHYTAYINPFVGRFGFPEGSAEGESLAWNSWLECDDSHVRQVRADGREQISNSVVTPAAYMLFYKLRG